MSLTRKNPEHAPLDSADARTLVLAALVLDDALLDRYVLHQETYLATAEEALRRGHTHAAALVEAHEKAASASGLTPREEGALAAAVRTFCTARLAVALLDRKLGRVQGETSGATVGAPTLAELQSERARLDAMVPLRQRFGADAVALLRAREPTLMPLHERTTRLLSRGG
ncbi:MAG: hypothetical protein L0Y64_22190 [Myxococcaceae bacterium]|nr:hypothetical protein [Myxococcaceae bacterium]